MSPPFVCNGCTKWHRCRITLRFINRRDYYRIDRTYSTRKGITASLRKGTGYFQQASSALHAADRNEWFLRKEKCFPYALAAALFNNGTEGIIHTDSSLLWNVRSWKVFFYANWNCAMNLGKCCSDGKSVFCADFSVKYIRTHSALFFIRYGLAVKNGGDFDERGKQRTGICPWILLFSTLRSIAAAFTRAYVLYGFVRFVRFVRVECSLLNR